MTVAHIEFLVEEPSMEAFLRGLMPRMLDKHTSFEIYPSQCKDDLLKQLPERLRGYEPWLPDDWRIVIIIDRDDDDCLELKRRLEGIITRAGLRSRGRSSGQNWQVVSRIAIEELEAWYFGDWQAVCQAYPRASRNVPRQANYRETDKIRGGTWEAFERVLQRAGYFHNGLRKVEAARVLGQLVDPQRNCSPSFRVFQEVFAEITTNQHNTPQENT